MSIRITNNKNRIMAGNIAIFAAYFGLIMALWNEYSWYSKVAPLGTLISFFALAFACLMYVDIKDMLKDREFYLVAAGCIITLINLFVIGSNKGAFLTAADFLMMLYLSDKMKMPKAFSYVVFAFTGFFFYYWTFDVKGYFKGYNTNYGGLVLITGFVFAMIGFECLRQYFLKTGKIKWAKFMILWYIWMFAWGYNIIAWYRARCAFLALLVFALLLIIPKKLLNKKWFHILLCLGTTLGSAVFSLIYIGLGNLSDKITISLFYKEAISGRNEIWRELWGAFLNKPITGIGSSYEMKIEWLEGMFEAHSAILDILFVHGIIVFVIAMILLISRLYKMRGAGKTSVGRFIICGTMALLCAGFLENYYIVPPYTFALLYLLNAGNCENIDSLV